MVKIQVDGKEFFVESTEGIGKGTILFFNNGRVAKVVSEPKIIIDGEHLRPFLGCGDDVDILAPERLADKYNGVLLHPVPPVSQVEIE